MSGQSDALSRLIRLLVDDEAGGELANEREAADRVRKNVHSEWRRSVQWRRVRLLGALTAGFFVLISAVLLLARTGIAGDAPTGAADSDLIASLQRQFGSVLVEHDALPEGRGKELARGTRITTGIDAGARIALGSGSQIRLARSARVELVNNAMVRLDAGALYFQSTAESSAQVLVETPYGFLRNQGTHYEVRVDAQGLEVAVRSGSVVLETRDGEAGAGAGGSLTVSENRVLFVSPAGVVRTEALRGDTRRFEWAEQLSEPFAIDGKTLGEFVAWYADETGSEVSYVAERGVRDLRLRGDLVWRDPLLALQPTLKMVGLRAELSGHTLVIVDGG